MRWEITDMPKLQSPFVRVKTSDGFVVTPEIEDGYDWVFNDPDVLAIEKLDGTNVSILVEDGMVKGIWNRATRVPFFNKGARHIIDGLLNSYGRGYMDMLMDGQHFGELIGTKINGNPYLLDDPIWIPFETYSARKLRYKSWGTYPKTFDSISKWFEVLQPLFTSMRGDTSGYVEGIVFTLRTDEGVKYAKLRRDMFDWFQGRRH